MKAAESSEEDMVAALSSIYSNRAVGKELQMDVDTHGPAQASMQEVRCLCQLDALTASRPSWMANNCTLFPYTTLFRSWE
jgi:hypothetical protein